MSFVELVRAHWLTAIFGSLLYISGIAIIFWNEGRAVKSSLSLDEALSDVIVVRPTDIFDSALNGRVVHITGPLVTGEPLTEPDYGIQVLAVRLKRRVQMLQWIEETVESHYGDPNDIFQTPGEESRTYYYRTEWRDDVVDSSGFHMRFGHENPTSIPLESRVQMADRVRIGPYELGVAVKDKVKPYISLTSDSRPDDPMLKMHDGFYYHSVDVLQPEVGDLRVMFAFAGLEGSKYTVVGQLREGKIVPYVSRFNVPVLLVHDGEHTPERALKTAHYSLKMKTWSVRAIGWLLIFFAVTSTSAIISATVCDLPLLWTLAPDPRQPVSGNILLTISLSLLVTSFAWMIQRPWLAAAMITASVSPFALFASSVVRYQRVGAA